MRSDTRYREARSSLLASLFVVLAVFVIGKEPPLLPSPPPVWWEETQWSIAIYLFIFCYRFDRWKCARFNNVDIAILICNNIMYGCSIRVIVKIIGNEAQGRKGWKMFKYFRRYILVLKSWDRKGIILRIETNSSAFLFLRFWRLMNLLTKKYLFELMFESDDTECDEILNTSGDTDRRFPRSIRNSSRVTVWCTRSGTLLRFHPLPDSNSLFDIATSAFLQSNNWPRRTISIFRYPRGKMVKSFVSISSSIEKSSSINNSSFPLPKSN